MITFQRVQLEDRPLLHPLLYGSGNWGCEYTFVNQYLWGRQEYAFVGGSLVLFAHWDGQSLYVYPVGGSDHRQVVELLMADAQKRGIPFRLFGINDRNKIQLEAEFPGLFHFQPRRGSFDYVYDIHRLADLGGKKMQQKRNHINRFVEANPNWYTEPVTVETLDICRDLAEKWYESHPDSDADHRALEKAMTHFEELGFEGIILYGENGPVGFSMGNRVSYDTFDVNFEKSFADIQGAYALVNREFARFVRQNHPEIQFLNREDDMGLENLRKAKESYHPILLEKFIAKEIL